MKNQNIVNPKIEDVTLPDKKKIQIIRCARIPGEKLLLSMGYHQCLNKAYFYNGICYAHWNGHMHLYWIEKEENVNVQDAQLTR